MMMLVATGIRLGLADPGQLALFRQLPFGLLSTFLVPLIIATHVFIFVKLFARRERTSGEASTWQTVHRDHAAATCGIS